MRIPSVLRRITATIVVVFGTAVSSLLPMADAYAERAAPDAYAHAEQAGSDDCAPIHDELACQLCRVLRNAPLSAAASSEPATLRQTYVPRNPSVSGFTPLRLAGARAPRAPPTA